MYYNITLVYILIMFVFVDMPYIFVIHIFSPHVLIYSLSEGLARNTPYDTKSWRWKKKSHGGGTSTSTDTRGSGVNCHLFCFIICQTK